MFLRRCLSRYPRTFSTFNQAKGNRPEPGDFIPITWKSVAAFLAVGAGGVYYLAREKQEMLQRIKDREAERQNMSYGTPKLGGPFNLTDCDSLKQVTEKDFMGKFMVIYFGFTHCPDICPDELEKMSSAITTLDRMKGIGELVTPVFISIDPHRDTPDVVKKYIKEFHPRFVGLTGTEEEIQKAAKQFRVYISKGDPAAENDYLVDHSIFFFWYLNMYPDGTFCDFYGRNATADDVVEGIAKHVKKWKVDLESGRVAVPSINTV